MESMEKSLSILWIFNKFDIIVSMKKVFVSRRVEKKLNKGQMVLEEIDFPELSETNQEVELFSQSKKFLGKAYLSSQNKGIGWFVTNQKVSFNQKFFESLFEKAKQKRSSYYQDELITAFRLFNQEGDGFGGMTLDLYGDYVVFSW